MKHIVALAFFVVAVSLIGQVQHAPTVAQCQADQQLLLSHMEHKVLGTPDFNAEIDEEKEMGDCERVDPPNYALYNITESEMDVDQATRLMNFIKSQGLWDKFIEEDKAGKR